MNISACFTHFNRPELLYEAVSPFLSDPRITEIVISDDASHMELFNTVYWQYASIDKVRIFRNEVNIDCYRNKAKVLECATSDWCLLLDSDNVFSKEFIDRIENLIMAGLNDKTIYQPEFARPHFNFTHLSGVNLHHGNIAELIDKGNTGTMLNAMNYFVNRHEYLKVFDPEMDPVTSDSIYQNYRWLNTGNSIYVVPGLQYDHRVHEGSHYQKNVRRTPVDLHNTIMGYLRSMK